MHQRKRDLNITAFVTKKNPLTEVHDSLQQWSSLSGLRDPSIKYRHIKAVVETDATDKSRGLSWVYTLTKFFFFFFLIRKQKHSERCLLYISCWKSDWAAPVFTTGLHRSNSRSSGLTDYPRGFYFWAFILEIFGHNPSVWLSFSGCLSPCCRNTKSP